MRSAVAMCKHGALRLLVAWPIWMDSQGVGRLLSGPESSNNGQGQGQGQAGSTSRLSLQSAVSVEIRANALAHSCPAKGYMPSGP